MAFTITPSSGGNGTITPNTPQSVTSGGNITFTATPSSGYNVSQWLLDGVPAQNGGASFTLTNVLAAHTVEVTFLALSALLPPQTQSQLIDYFLNGQTPTQEQFAELIATMFYYANQTAGVAAAAAAQVDEAAAITSWLQLHFTDGIGDNAIDSSYNIASVVKSSPGGVATLTITFTNPLADSDYLIVTSPSTGAIAASGSGLGWHIVTQSTTQLVLNRINPYTPTTAWPATNAKLRFYTAFA